MSTYEHDNLTSMLQNKNRRKVALVYDNTCRMLFSDGGEKYLR